LGVTQNARALLF